MISFEARAGGEVAKLGHWEVGQVVPWPYGKSFRAYWALFLPPASVTPLRAADVRSGKRALLLRIADWLDGADDPARAAAVRAQADALDEVAA